MYFVEVYFENGKILRKETNSLNESYATYNRYSTQRNHKQPVIKIISGKVCQQ